MVGLQLGRSGAAPLHDTGFGGGESRIFGLRFGLAQHAAPLQGNCNGNSSAAEAEQLMRFFCRS
jgi:hypothetical protein